MINKVLTPKQILAVPCPTCGADRNKSCETTSYELGAEEHRERRWAASDKRLSRLHLKMKRIPLNVRCNSARHAVGALLSTDLKSSDFCSTSRKS
jgi:hypothetical protein